MYCAILGKQKYPFQNFISLVTLSWLDNSLKYLLIWYSSFMYFNPMLTFLANDISQLLWIIFRQKSQKSANTFWHSFNCKILQSDLNTFVWCHKECIAKKKPEFSNNFKRAFVILFYYGKLCVIVFDLFCLYIKLTHNNAFSAPEILPIE